MKGKPNGYGTVELDKVRPFHVGIEQGEVFALLPNRQREDGRPMSLKAYDKLFSPVSLSQNDLSGGDVRDFLYSSLVAGCRVDGLEIDFTPQQVSYWIDEADANEVSKPFKQMLAQLLLRYQRQLERLKNGEAPNPAAETGPPPAQP